MSGVGIGVVIILLIILYLFDTRGHKIRFKKGRKGRGKHGGCLDLGNEVCLKRILKTVGIILVMGFVAFLISSLV